MGVWTAFIIVQAMMAPMPLVNSTRPGPADITVGQEAPAKPDISVKVQPDPTTHVDRMTGVEADTYVYSPAVALLTFPSQEMCETAAAILRGQTGTLSASCVRTQ